MTARLLALALLQALVVLLLLTWLLGLRNYDFTVPLDYWGDTLWFASLVKGMVLNGWTAFIPQLSAPFGLSAAAFPSMSSFDWLLMKVVAIFTSEPGAILNAFWMLSIVLTAWTASISLRLLDLPAWLCFGTGVLFALLPFAFARHTAHISLVYYTVPLIALLTIFISTGCPDGKNSKAIQAAGYVGLLIQGLNYIYFSFYAVALLVISAFIGFIRSGNRKTIKVAALSIALVLTGSAVNLSPSFMSWEKFGKPDGLDTKSPAEAEVYGLKIRRLLVPSVDNVLLGWWARADERAQFPNENENGSARLGPFASAGFLLTLWLVIAGRIFGQQKRDLQLQSAAALALCTLLICTVGGFGAIFNALIAPDIRAYNRFSVFLAFYSMAALCIWSHQAAHEATGGRARVAPVALALLIAFSLYDQLFDAKPIRTSYAKDMLAAKEERALIDRLEVAMPTGGAVYQLPSTPFPSDPGVHRMTSYDHARPFLWSKSLRWSWPSFSQDHTEWTNRVKDLTGTDLLRALALSGFSAIWVDRFGYEDGGESVLRTLERAGVGIRHESFSGRYVVLDIGPVASKLIADTPEAERKMLMDRLTSRGLSIQFSTGFFGWERTAQGVPFQWSSGQSKLTLRNRGGDNKSGALTLELQSQVDGLVQARIGDQLVELKASPRGEPTSIAFEISSHGAQDIVFRTLIPRVKAPGETRDLHFAVMNPRIVEIQERK